MDFDISTPSIRQCHEYCLDIREKDLINSMESLKSGKGLLPRAITIFYDKEKKIFSTDTLNFIGPDEFSIRVTDKMVRSKIDKINNEIGKVVGVLIIYGATMSKQDDNNPLEVPKGMTREEYINTQEGQEAIEKLGLEQHEVIFTCLEEPIKRYIKAMSFKDLGGGIFVFDEEPVLESDQIMTHTLNENGVLTNFFRDESISVN